MGRRRRRVERFAHVADLFAPPRPMVAEPAELSQEDATMADPFERACDRAAGSMEPDFKAEVRSAAKVCAMTMSRFRVADVLAKVRPQFMPNDVRQFVAVLQQCEAAGWMVRVLHPPSRVRLYGSRLRGKV